MYLNPQLVCNSDYALRLREIELAMFVQHLHWQSFEVKQTVEKIRLPLAFLDMLLAKQRVQKVLYLVSVSSAKSEVAQSLALHTNWQVIDILHENIQDVNAIEQQVILSSLIEFIDTFAQASTAEQFLAQFDLVVVEHSDLKIYELVQYRLKYVYRKPVFELIYKPQVLHL